MNKKGFTLIEILIVIALLAVLAGILLVSVNPAARLADSRNVRRWTDVNAILSAIKKDQVDNGGSYHANIAAMNDNTYYQIGEAATGCNTSCTNPPVILQSGCIDISDLITEGYLGSVPNDPNAAGTSYEITGYYLYKYDSGQISVGACHEELGSNEAVQVVETTQ